MNTRSQQQSSATQSVQVCRQFRRSAAVVLLLCAFLQWLIDPGALNNLSVVLVLISSFVTLQTVVRASVFRVAPLPALIVLGFNVATSSGALVAQTFSLRAITFNLQVPVFTFGGCAIFQLSLLASLWIFLLPSGFRSSARVINRVVARPMGLMRAPTPGQLWMMGLLGAGVLAWSATVAYSGEVAYGDVGDKFLLGLTYLVYAPFLIPIARYVYPEARPVTRINLWLLLGYTLLLVVIGVAGNSRGAFAMGVANMGMASFVLVLMGQLVVSAKLRRALLIGAFVLLATMPTLSDLATAMVVVRGERGTVSSAQLVSRTFAAFQDKAALQAYRKTMSITTAGEYSETYLSNPFLARFVETKFFDNTLALKDVSTQRHSAALWEITLDKTLALLPTPVLKLTGIDVDKSQLGFSIGDALYNQQFGSALGGYRVGSTLAHGLAMMGAFTYVAVIPLFLLVFVALQALTSTNGAFVVISPVILLQFMRIYYLADGDSLLGAVTLLLRGLPQDILLYALIFHLTRLMTTVLPTRRYALGQSVSLQPGSNLVSGHGGGQAP